MIHTGIRGTNSITVTDERSAKRAGSGTIDVYSTPAMIALMEKTALDSVEPYLEEGQATVGTKLDISHDSATPIGMRVTCETQLVEIDGRRLVFEVEAFDGSGRIGGGRHERFIIDKKKFLEKANQKLQSN